jgi:hypothetical protein
MSPAVQLPDRTEGISAALRDIRPQERSTGISVHEKLLSRLSKHSVITSVKREHGQEHSKEKLVRLEIRTRGVTHLQAHCFFIAQKHAYNLGRLMGRRIVTRSGMYG